MERVEGYRHFINKLWNASRFAMMNLEGYDPERLGDLLAGGKSAAEIGLSLADRWVLSRLQRTAAKVEQALEELQLSEAAIALYDFIWKELCDWYIELAKPALGSTGPARAAAQGTLATVLEQSLRLLHPFAPFVTEEIWQKLPKPSSVPASLMVTMFPGADPRLIDEAAEAEMGDLQEIAGHIRSIRSTYSVPPAQTIAAEVRVPDAALRGRVEAQRAVIELAAKVKLAVAASGAHVPSSARAVYKGDVEIVVPLAGLIDLEAEKGRLGKEIGKAEKEIAGIEKKLGNEQFLANAPAEVVEEQRARLVAEQARRARLVAGLEALG
jgi:valyl-tRNA synthetase